MNPREVLEEAQDSSYQTQSNSLRTMMRTANILYACYGFSMIMAIMSGNINAAIAWLCAIIMNMTHNGTTKSRMRILRMEKRFEDETRRLI